MYVCIQLSLLSDTVSLKFRLDSKKLLSQAQSHAIDHTVLVAPLLRLPPLVSYKQATIG